jgi:4'-phosphopantetheinyl transferase
MGSSYYTAPLNVTHDEGHFSAGICISKESFEDLYRAREKFLHKEELVYFSSLSFPKRQLSYLVGRNAAKKALSAHLREEIHTQASIEYGVFGQPIVSCPAHHNLQISISHSASLGAALSFPEAVPMGIDVEMVCEERRSTIETQATPFERNLCKGIDSMTMLWATKEALAKVLKSGFLISFELLEVANIREQGSCTRFDFTHFYHYQALSFPIANAVCSIVYPKKTNLVVDIVAIQRQIGSYGC